MWLACLRATRGHAAGANLGQFNCVSYSATTPHPTCDEHANDASPQRPYRL